MPTDRLLWMRFPSPTCPECGRPVEFRKVTLGFQLEGRALTLELTAGRCATDKLWLADLVAVVAVEEALDELDLNLLEVERFSVDGTAADAALWMGEGLGTIP